MRRWESLVIAAAALVSSVAMILAGADADGSVAEADPSLPRVTMITDSVGGVLFWVASARDELAKGLDFHLEAKSCRKLVSPGCYAYDETPPSALETVRALGAEIGALVVIDVGYNDLAEGYADGIDTIMGALTAFGVQKVIWVTLEEAQGTWVSVNAQIRAAAQRWPQLVVADWAAVAAGQPSWFADGVHMNDVGGLAFARFLRSVLLEACGAACVPPPALATMLGPVVARRTATLRWQGSAAAVAYDVAVKRRGGPWRTVASRLEATSYRVRAEPGARLQARVRARDADDVPGPWSQPRSFRV